MGPTWGWDQKQLSFFLIVRLGTIRNSILWHFISPVAHNSSKLTSRSILLFWGKECWFQNIYNLFRFFSLNLTKCQNCQNVGKRMSLFSSIIDQLGKEVWVALKWFYSFYALSFSSVWLCDRDNRSTTVLMSMCSSSKIIQRSVIDKQIQDNDHNVFRKHDQKFCKKVTYSRTALNKPNKPSSICSNFPSREINCTCIFLMAAILRAFNSTSFCLDLYVALSNINFWVFLHIICFIWQNQWFVKRTMPDRSAVEIFS